MAHNILLMPEHMKNSFYEDYLKDKVESGQIKSYSAEPIPTTPWFIDMLPTIFVLLIFVAFWFVFMQQSQGGAVELCPLAKVRLGCIKKRMVI